MSENENNRFDRDGFVVLRQFFAGNELARLRDNLARVIRDVMPTMPPEHVFYEDKGRPETLKQLQMLHTHDRYFAELFLGGPIKELAERLLADDAIGKNLQFFNKPPGVGQPTPPHQDGYYFKLTPCQALTMWLALDDVDEENGCVRYVKGSNRRGMRKHQQSNVLGFSQAMTDFGRPEDLENEVSVPAEPGDLLVHHALTIHRSAGNRSLNRPRRSLGFIYFANCSTHDETTLNEYQAKLKEKLTTSGKI